MLFYTFFFPYYIVVLKVKLYAANYPCVEPYGHVCKWAVSVHEDDFSVKLEPREHATVFILRKPGLNGNLQTGSLELDDHRGYYLKRDGVKFVAAKNDGSGAYREYCFVLNNYIYTTYGL